MGGQIVDATLVPAPKQRNTEEEKAEINAGKSARQIWCGNLADSLTGQSRDDPQRQRHRALQQCRARVCGQLGVEWHYIAPGKPMQNEYVESFNVRMRDELLNETLFLSITHARIEIAAWLEHYNRERPQSSLGYATQAAFAAELYRQWPASLYPKGSAVQPIASTALMRKTTTRL